MEGVLSQPPGKLDRPRAALEVTVAVPGVDQLLVVALVGTGTVGEEAARLGRPGEERDVVGAQPRLPGIVGGGEHALPDRVDHLGEREIVGKNARPPTSRLVGMGDRRVHALARPVRSAIDGDAAGTHLGIHGIDEFTDRHIGIVAMHHVDLHPVGLQPVERLAELAGDHVGIDERRMGALAEDHHLVADAGGGEPVAHETVGFAVAVEPGRVEEVAAALVEGVEHHGRLGVGLDIGGAERDHRDLVVDARELAPAHRACRLDERPAVDLCPAAVRLLELVFEADCRPPFVEHLHVAECVRPAHSRGRELALPCPDGVGRRHRSRSYKASPAPRR